MILPPGGSPSLASVLWSAMIVVLALAGLIVLRRWMWRRFRDLPSGRVMNRTVRGLGVVAAVLFVGYWFETAERRAAEAAFVDVVDTLLLYEMPGYDGGRFDEGDGTCRASGEWQRDMLAVRSKFGRVGERRIPLVAAEAFGVWEEFAERAQDGGWEVRRFVDEGPRQRLKLWGQKGDAVFSLQAFPNTNPGLGVTVDECLGQNFLPDLLESDFVEVDSFLQ